MKQKSGKRVCKCVWRIRIIAFAPKPPLIDSLLLWCKSWESRDTQQKDFLTSAAPVSTMQQSEESAIKEGV
jgi:hypothetical protein